MAKIKIELTENHIKLIKELRIEKIGDNYVGFDTIEPYGGNYLMEDLAMIFGFWDKAVEGTEKNYDGRKFGLDNEKFMLDIHMYLMDNFDYILSIITQFVTTGIKPGLYTAIDYNLKWVYKEII